MEVKKIIKRKREILVNFYAGVNPEDYGVCKSRINYKPESIRDLGCEYSSLREVSDEIGISLTTIKDALKTRMTIPSKKIDMIRYLDEVDGLNGEDIWNVNVKKRYFETTKKLSTRKKNGRRVLCYNYKTKEFLSSHDTITDGAGFYKVERVKFTRCLSGRQKRIRILDPFLEKDYWLVVKYERLGKINYHNNTHKIFWNKNLLLEDYLI